MTELDTTLFDRSAPKPEVPAPIPVAESDLFERSAPKPAEKPKYMTEAELDERFPFRGKGSDADGIIIHEDGGVESIPPPTHDLFSPRILGTGEVAATKRRLDPSYIPESLNVPYELEPPSIGTVGADMMGAPRISLDVPERRGPFFEKLEGTTDEHSRLRRETIAGYHAARADGKQIVAEVEDVADAIAQDPTLTSWDDQFLNLADQVSRVFPGILPEALPAAIEHEMEIRHHVKGLKEGPGWKKALASAIVPFTEVPQSLVGVGLSAEAEAVKRVIAEQNEISAANLDNILNISGSAANFVMELFVLRAVSPAKIPAFLKGLKPATRVIVTGSLSAAQQFAKHAAIKGVVERQPLGDIAMSTAESAFMGMLLGPTGKIPLKLKPLTAPAIVLAFREATRLRGGSPEDIDNATIMAAGFQLYSIIGQVAGRVSTKGRLKADALKRAKTVLKSHRNAPEMTLAQWQDLKNNVTADELADVMMQVDRAVTKQAKFYEDTMDKRGVKPIRHVGTTALAKPETKPIPAQVKPSPKPIITPPPKQPVKAPVSPKAEKPVSEAPEAEIVPPVEPEPSVQPSAKEVTEPATVKGKVSADVKKAADVALAKEAKPPAKPVEKPTADQVSPKEVGPQPEKGELSKEQKKAQLQFKRLSGQVKKKGQQIKVHPVSQLKKMLRRDVSVANDAVKDVIEKGTEFAKWAQERFKGTGLVPKKLGQLITGAARIQDKESQIRVFEAAELLARQLEGDVTALPTKLRIERITGVKKTPEAMFQRKQLNAELTKQGIIARKVYLEAGRAMVATGRELTNLTAERLGGLDVTPAQRKRLMRVASTARTPSQKVDAMATVELVAQAVEKKAAIERLKNAVTDTRLEIKTKHQQAAFDSIVKSFQKTDPTADIVRKSYEMLEATNELRQTEGLEQIPDQLIQAGKEFMRNVEKPPLKSMTLQEVEQVEAIVTGILQQAKTFNRVRAEKTRREFNDLIESGISDVSKLFPNETISLNEMIGAPTLINRRLRGAAGVLFDNSDTLALKMTADQSELWDTLVWKPFEAQSEGMGLMYEGAKPVIDAMKKAGLTDADRVKMSPDMGKPGSGRTLKSVLKASRTLNLKTATWAAGKTAVKKAPVESIQATPAEIMALSWMARDPKVRSELLRNKQKGFVFQVDRFDGKSLKLGIADLDAIESQLTDGERAVVDAMHKYVNGPLAKSLNEFWRRKFGFDLTRNKNYSPSRRLPQVDDPQDTIIQSIVKHRLQLMTNQGFTKPRKGGDQPYVVDDIFHTFYNHIARTSEMLAKDEAYTKARSLLADTRTKGIDGVDGFATQVKKRVPNGAAIIKRLLDRLDKFGTVEATTDMSTKEIAKMTRRLLRAFSTGKLSGKLWIPMFQKVSQINAGEVVGSANMLKAKVQGPITAAEEAEMLEIPYIRMRLEGSSHQIMSPGMAHMGTRQLFLDKPLGWFETLGREDIPLKKKYKEIFAWLSPGKIHRADRKTIGLIWRAAKIKNAGDLKASENDLMLATMRTQPTWDDLSSPDIINYASQQGMGPALVKFLTLFSSQRSKNSTSVNRGMIEHSHNLRASRRKLLEDKKAGVGSAEARAKHWGRTSKSRVKLMKSIFRHIIVTSAAVFAIRLGWDVALSGGKDERWNDWVYWFNGLIDKITGNVPIPIGVAVSDPVKASVNRLRGGKLRVPGGFGRDTVIAGVWDDVGDAVVSLDEAFTAAPHKKQEALERAILEWARFASDLGAPTDGPVQVWKKLNTKAKAPKGGPSRTGRSGRKGRGNR